jgi:hypothetical protein
MTISSAKALIEAADADGVTLRPAADDGVTIKGSPFFKDKYVSAVKAAKPWVRAALQPEDPDPEHRCRICQRPARFGTGVRLLRGQEGIWFCGEHRA